MVDQVDKVAENRVRRVAARQGQKLVKSPRRDPRALGYGRYWLRDAATGQVRAGDPVHGMSLAEAQTVLEGGQPADQVPAELWARLSEQLKAPGVLRVVEVALSGSVFHSPEESERAGELHRTVLEILRG